MFELANESNFGMIENQDGEKVLVISSVDVAKRLERKHEDILDQIKGRGKTVGIIPSLLAGNFPVSDFFIESTYTTEDGRTGVKCYLCTNLGCQLIANKQQGAKGIQYTAWYVKRFNEMENMLRQQQQNAYIRANQKLQLEYDEEKDYANKLDDYINMQEERIQELESRNLVLESYTEFVNNQPTKYTTGKKLHLSNNKDKCTNIVCLHVFLVTNGFPRKSKAVLGKLIDSQFLVVCMGFNNDNVKPAPNFLSNGYFEVDKDGNILVTPEGQSYFLEAWKPILKPKN